MSEIVDRIAQAIFAKDEHWLVLGGDVWEKAPRIQREKCIRQAIAALNETRKPTEAMCQAAYEKAGCPSDWQGFEEMWGAAIDAALKR